MRFVIFDEESLEPITVVDLPGLSDMALAQRQVWRVSVPPSKSGTAADASGFQFIDLKFEQISRLTLSHGDQVIWMCLTRAADLAMLLNPEWLPGQRPAVQQLQEENLRLKQLLAGSLSAGVGHADD